MARSSNLSDVGNVYNGFAFQQELDAPIESPFTNSKNSVHVPPATQVVMGEVIDVKPVQPSGTVTNVQTPQVYDQGNFIPSSQFAGNKPGYKFEMGAQGLGYYIENPTTTTTTTTNNSSTMISNSSPKAPDRTSGRWPSGEKIIYPKDVKGCWYGYACSLFPWAGTIEPIDEDTYTRNFQMVLWPPLPLCGRYYKRTDGTNTFVWTGTTNPDEDWENFTSDSCACMAPGQPPDGCSFACKLCG